MNVLQGKDLIFRMNYETPITHLNGKNLYYTFLAGFKRLLENQKEINDLNVFPVPDADTGTNLASTLQAVIDNVIPEHNIKLTSTAMADAALIGARGNSGIIMAQFLYGFSNELANESLMTIKQFAQALIKAVDYMYQSVANPVEGTILTVLREWAEFIYNLKDKTEDFIDLMNQSYNKALESLSATRERLEILTKKNVVDAGAQGFVYFLEGMISFFKDLKLKTLAGTRQKVVSELETSDMHEEITYRYCTEALLDGKDLNRQELLDKLKCFGDSIVVAGSSKRMRVHVHTDHPDQVFEMLGEVGTFSLPKVDDMQLQYDISHFRKNKIGLIVDSCSDIPRAIRDKRQIMMIPLVLNVGKRQFLDQITIKPSVFYKYLEGDEYPTTSQPSYREFVARYSYLASHYDSVISVSISSGLSGTYKNSSDAAKQVVQNVVKPITVVDSKACAGSFGLLVLRISDAIEQGMSYDEILKKIEEWKPKSKIYVGVRTLKYFVKGGRISPLKGMIAKLINLKPIVSMEDGNGIIFGKAFSRKSNIKKILNLFKEDYQKNGIHSYCVSYSNIEEEKNAIAIAIEMEKICGKAPLYISPITPVLGVNAGIGTVAVSYQIQ